MPIHKIDGKWQWGQHGKKYKSKAGAVKQMNFAGDIMKDLSSVDKNLSKACYYDTLRGTTADKKY